MTYDAVIIGAGPGGSVAALALARAGLKVAIFEKNVFPRNKLCGEFLSGEGAATVESFGLEGRLRAAGANSIRSVVITASGGARYEGAAPSGAISLSRFSLDTILLEEVAASGADVFAAEAVRDVNGSLADGFAVASRSREIRARTVVCATGRNGRIVDRICNGRQTPATASLVAFKMYYSGEMPANVVELHAFSGGYCGLQRVENGAINACWVSRASVLREAGGKAQGMIARTFSQNHYLRARLKHLKPSMEAFLAVSNFDFRSRTPVASEILMVGDSAGMIAPMCGDGMAMAMRSGMQAARLVEAYARGSIDDRELVARYTSDWKRTFLPRMWLGALLHAGMERRRWCSMGVRACRRFPILARLLADGTRG